MRRHAKFRDFCYRQLFPKAGLLLVKALSSTYRYRLADQDCERAALERHGTVVYAGLHQRFFAGITFFASRRPIAIMISQSRDGEMIARLVDTLGWRAVRGSSTRGGMRALKEIRRLTGKGYRVAHIVDGPQGPFGVVKPGLISIAQFAGIPIIPGTSSAQRYWVVPSWDRFIIPKPFSRVIIRFGRPVDVPRKLDPEAFERIRLDVEKQIKELVDQTDKWWRRPEIINHYFP